MKLGMGSNSPQRNSCPVCKSGIDGDTKIIPIFVRDGAEDPRKKSTPKRPAAQRSDAPQAQIFPGLQFGFMFMPFGAIGGFGGFQATNLQGQAVGDLHAFISRLFLMIATLVLVTILLY